MSTWTGCVRLSRLGRLSKHLAGWLAVLLVGASAALAGTVSGTITDAETGDPLPGANVILDGTGYGTATDLDGTFTLSDVPNGEYSLTVRFIGYTPYQQTINVGDGGVTVDVALVPEAYVGRELTVVAQRARSRETPVAFTNIEKSELAQNLGSRDIPLLLNITPGVYATAEGGGAGDARINIRGFNQRNVAVMINGVPVNDMENGWVYWSNWDGLGDVTSSIQVQRGLGASKLAIASVGGTMNIVTDAAAQQPGASFKQEVGAGNFLKSTLVANTGLMDNGFAITLAGVRKLGDGLIDQTWSDAWAYFGTISYTINSNHRLDLFAIGAPQRHGHRLYTQPIETLDAEYAAELGIDVSGAPDRGLAFNPNWGPIDAPADALQEFYNGDTHDFPGRTTDEGDFVLMERENYYHKPQINLNWYWQASPNVFLTNVVYYSRGKGGGSGIFGAFPGRLDNGQINFQAAYEANLANIDTVEGITGAFSQTALRNSVNQQYWVGYLGTGEVQLSDALKLTTGLDARYYIGEHWRELRTLIGGDYMVDSANRNADSNVKQLGDKIGYHNDGLTRWLGGFAQLEGRVGELTAVVSGSVSTTGYKRVDYFREQVNGDWDQTGWENFPGFTVKGGANYNLSRAFNVFGNVGVLNKAPIFGAVYNFDNSIYEPTVNEKVRAVELGTGYRNAFLAANVNLYSTHWQDRSWPTQTQVGANNYYFLLRGIDARHSGVEIDLKTRPHRMLELYAMASLGDWEWLNDVTTTFAPEDQPENTVNFNIYTEGLKVGDAAQKTYALRATVFPTRGMYANVTYNLFTDHYADFNPAGRTDPNDREQSWELPNYGLVNLSAGYTLPVDLPGNASVDLALNVFNLLDTTHITDADDRGDHTADDALVFFGLPRSWNTSIRINL